MCEQYCSTTRLEALWESVNLLDGARQPFIMPRKSLPLISVQELWPI